MKIVAIIPARGGSKGLPNKNLRLLMGKPMIAYSIEAALQAGNIDECYVTSDSDKILAVAKKYGAQTLKRPAELSTDLASTQDAIHHALSLITKDKYTHLLLLQPTSPVRNADDVKQAISNFDENKYKSLVSVCENTHSPFKDFKEEQGALSPLFSTEMLSMPRQKLPKTMRQNGALYLIEIATFKQFNAFYAAPCQSFVMPEAHSIDVDFYSDFLAAKQALKIRKKTSVF